MLDFIKYFPVFSCFVPLPERKSAQIKLPVSYCEVNIQIYHKGFTKTQVTIILF